MPIRVLIAHARGEESCADELAIPLREAGFEVAHEGTVLVGDSVVEDASRILNESGPVVLCGTIKAVGTKWARTVVNAARGYGCKVFCVQMAEEADVEPLAFGEKVAEYWQDPARALRELTVALRAAYPADEEEARQVGEDAAEVRYRRLALESCDIVDLANLPESERHIATRKLELRRLYVPLSVIVEARDEPDTPHDTLEALEKRRAERRGWWRAAKESAGSVTERDLNPRVALGERLAASRRLVVLGDPGAGKTTLLRWLATAYLLRLKRDPDRAQLPAVETLPDEEWLPVIIRCRDLPPECVSGALDDVLVHTLRKSELGESESEALRRLVRTRLDQGRALLLIDGLDEIGDAALRSRFAQQLEHIHIAFPTAPIIVTSRIVGYREMGYRIGRGFEHVSVADFAPEEKDDFARRWCALTELPERRDTATRELISDIHSTDRIERLTGNPMLLTTMALVKRKIGRLPSGRAELYWEALQVLLNWRREVDLPIDHREAVPQLEYLAYDMCNRAVQQIREDEILELLDRMREEYPRLHEVRRRNSGDFLRALEGRTGIVVNTGEVRHLGRPISVYEFRHLTFQEYLAGLALVDGVYPDRTPSEVLARAIARISGKVDEVDTQDGTKETVTAENWREAVRLAVTNAKYDEADDVLRAVLKANEGEIGTRRPRAILASLCLADEPRVSEEVAAEVMQGLVQAIDHQDRSEQPDTALHLAAIGVMASRWKKSFEAILVDEFIRRLPAERAPVAHVLSTSLSSVPGIRVSQLEISEAGKTEREAIVALVAARAQSSYPDTSFPHSLALAVESLGRSAPLTHASLIFLDWAMYSIPTKEQEEYAGPVSDAIERFWDDAGVREAGLKMVEILKIGAFKSLAEVELRSPDPHIRRAAAQALGEIGDSTAVQLLSEKLLDEDEGVSEAAAFALGALANTQAVAVLIEALSDKRAGVRAAVADSLGSLKDARAVSPLVSRLGDADASVRSAAAESLGMLRDGQAIDPLLGILADNQSDIRGEAVHSLGAIGGSQLFESLVTYLSDSDARVQGATAIVFAESRDERALEPLIERLLDDNEGVRQLVRFALARLASAVPVGALLAHLSSENIDIRNVIIEVLGVSGNVAALGPLVGLLSDPDESKRQSAAKALGQLGKAEAVDSLRASLSDISPHVRQSVLGALAILRKDEMDRQLLSRDLDGLSPFLDPAAPLTDEWVQHAGKRLNLSPEEVRRRYHALAPELNLVLHFDQA